MSYLGKVDMNDANIKHYSLTGSTLTVIPIGWTPASEQSLRVTINGVVQQGDTFSYSGSNLTLGGPLVVTDTLEVVGIQSVGNIITPADNSVTTTKLESSVSARLGVEWQAVQTTGFTAVAGKGYPCNTTAGAFTATLPASASVGDQISIVDYAGTFNAYFLSLDPNGLKMEGATSTFTLSSDREGVTITYADVTQGWVATSGVNTGSPALGAAYLADFLVVAGGGSGGGGYQSGGGGAGGYRASYNSETSGGGGASESSLTFNAGIVYTVTVGAGAPAKTTDGLGNDGSLSLISGSDITTISSAAGGGGGSYHTTRTGSAGGSGGGAANYAGTHAGGSGTSNQGYDGGTNTDPYASPYCGCGGGGAGVVGASTSGSSLGNGGNGTVSTITNASITRGGGGGGGVSVVSASGSGGAGGGGAGALLNANAPNATVNTGGGSGGSGTTTYNSGSGGSGVVVLRMPTANYSTTTTGSPSVATSGSDTILTFTGSGSYTG
jgi:hypothetical protein